MGSLACARCYCTSLKESIERRDGKVVFRPDSGDPELILCGYRFERVGISSSSLLEVFSKRETARDYFDRNDAVLCSDGVYVDRRGTIRTQLEIDGCIRILDKHFGSHVNEKGYRVISDSVGLIYGDSITLERCKSICSRLREMGFSTSNVVFGVGSFTYQYNTRDTFSIACKATWAQVDGVGRDIFKDPVTDDGTKKSACGLLCVYQEGDCMRVKDRCSREEEEATILEEVFFDGIYKSTSWESVIGNARGCEVLA